MKAQSRRRFLRGSVTLAGLGLLTGCGLGPFAGREPKRAARVGFLAVTSAQLSVPNLEAFREGMRAQGYQEDRDFGLEVRDAEGRNERLPDLANDLVEMPVDVIVAVGLAAILAARNATAAIPIVMTGVGSDPVALGLVASLGRPGGNVTGWSNLDSELNGKRIDLLREMLPALSRLVWLRDLTNPGNASTNATVQPAVQGLGIQVQELPLQSADDIEAAFEAASREQAEALLVGGTPFMQINRARIVDQAARHRLPAIYVTREFVEAGGLMAYGASRTAGYRRATAYVDKILKGAKPADLPVEQPTVFEFVINLKTAEAIGLTIPPSVLAQATEIIQ